MDKCVQEFQRLDLEVGRVKRLPNFLCNNFNCIKNGNIAQGDIFPELEQTMSQVQEIKVHLDEFLQDDKDIRQMLKEIANEIEASKENVKEIMDKMHPAVKSKLKEEFPEIMQE